MMLFLLSQDENDLLLIDQPEDDLDSQTVYEEVVKLLRTIKPRRQFIFATHNANFPVLGDAETVTEPPRVSRRPVGLSHAAIAA